MPGGTEIASLYASIGADTRDFLKGLSDTDNGMSALEKTTNALGTTFKAAFAVGVAAIGALTAVIADSVGKAANMEQGVADIGAMMALTSDETAKLEEHIMDLGLDPNLKVSATEASAAVMALGTAGLSVTEILGGASEATVLLANATGLKGGSGLSNAANIATDVMQQFNITAGQMDTAVNQIAGTTVASKFTIDDYRLAIAQAGGVAGAVGVEFDDFNAMIAATSSSFASGSDAGTSMKTMLQRLVPSTNPARDAMDQLGLRTAEGASAFFDATGKMKSAEEVAGLLHTAFSGLSDAQKIEAASTIFGTDAMRTALALAEGGTPIITAMKAEIGRVDAEELAAKRMNTFQGALEIAQGVIETISISIGNKFLPVLRPLIEKFSELAQTYGPMVIEFFGSIADKMAASITAFTTLKLAYEDGSGALMNFLAALGLNEEMAQKIGQAYWDLKANIGTVIESVKLAIQPITDAIGKFVTWKDVLTALGILIGGAVLSAIGALVAALWPIISTIALVTAAVATARAAWQSDFMGIRTYIIRQVTKITEWFKTSSGLWQGTWQDSFLYIANIVSDFVKSIPFKLMVMWWDIDWQARHTTDIVRGIVTEWVDYLVRQFNHWKSVAVETFAKTKDKIIENWNLWVAPTLKDLSDWASITKAHFLNWIDGIVERFTRWKDKMLELFQPVFDWWEEHVKPWIDYGRNIIQGLWDGMEETWHRFTQWTSTTWERWVNRFKNLFGIHSPSAVFENFGTNIVTGLAKGIDGARDMVYGAMDGLSAGMNASMSTSMDYAYAGANNAGSEDATLLRAVVEELRLLRATLNAKNMTANVTVAGGGENIGALTTYTAMGRG